MTSPLATLRSLVEDGGLVIPPLLGIALVLFYALGERLYTLRRGSRAPLRALFETRLHGRPQGHSAPRGTLLAFAVARATVLVEHAPTGSLRPRLDAAFADLIEGARRHAVLVRSLVGLAPLLGLLGTVSGMIETFQSLGSMTLFSQSGGVAGGVSEALISTQVGLVIAVPGLLLGRALDRKERSLTGELEELKDIACQATGGRP